MAMSENSIKVFEYVKAHENENITAADIAEALGFDMEDGRGVKQVNGIVTASFQRHREEINGEKVIIPLMERVEGEIQIEQPDGTVKHKTVKFIKMTDAGRAFVPTVA